MRETRCHIQRTIWGWQQNHPVILEIALTFWVYNISFSCSHVVIVIQLVSNHASRRGFVSVCGLDVAMCMAVYGSDISFVFGNAQ